MELYSSNDNYKLYQGNMLDMLDIIEKESIDSIVTDPPYELNFMSKNWDSSGIAFQPDTWKKCYEVLKDGGYLLAFGGSRTFHRIACAIEDAGFEIRDTIMWLYGSGFPKSMDISKQIDKRADNNNEVIKAKKELGKWLKEKRGNRPQKEISKYFPSKTGGLTGCVANWEKGYNLPTWEIWVKLKKILDLDDRYDYLIEGRPSNYIEAEREIIGKMKKPASSIYSMGENKMNRDVNITIPSTELAKQWQGWGTALKPSYESIIIAQKPYSIEIYLLIGMLDILNEVIDKCQLNLNANIVEKISKLNQAKQSVEENIVLNNAESKMFTKEDLLEVMDMLQSTLTENTNLNTELLCLNFLVEICNQMSKYTTETKINLITELKILKLLVVENILKNTMEENKIKQLGMKQNVLTVEEFLKEEKLKLNYMNILSVQDNVILKEEESSLHPKLNQIIVARKPFKGSLVDNVIKNGVGGINIDECRVETNELKPYKAGFNKGLYNDDGWNGKEELKEAPAGRFPANTILTYDETDFEEVCGGFPYTKNGGQNETSHRETWFRQETTPTRFAGDSGSASRYFYNAKASKRDRDEGLDEFEAKQKYYCDGRGNSLEIFGSTDGGRKPLKNIHPTVKPTSLMQYLVRLVTPNNGIILDPFNGSGSTGKAVMYENKERNKNYKYIGIELTEEYLPIAKARIEYVCKLAKEEKNEERQLSIYDL